MSPHQDRSPSATLGDVGEFAVIDALTSRLPEVAGVDVGPGDDAAVIRANDGRVVVCTDMLIEGVHFRSDWAPPEDIGRRAALACMADVAAMGALPTGLVVGVAAPSETATDVVTGIGWGIAAAAAELGAGLIGGDLARADRITISVTALGDLRGAAPVLRSGARPGDQLALAGRVGWAAAGLAVLSRGFRSPLAVVNAYKVPEPPLAAGPLAAAAGATSMIDISDGLVQDLGHIAAASGVHVDIDTALLVVPPRLAEVASALGKNAMDWLLAGGEDHALAATFPPDAELPRPWRVIGTVTAPVPAASNDSAPGSVTVDGVFYDKEAGWEHFR